MALTITLKQHDTRPVQNIGLLAPNPADITTTIAADLTNAASAKLNAKAQQGSDTFSSALTFASPRTGGVVVWTPVAGDTDTAGTYNAEVEVTWSDGGIETFPNDGNFTIQITGDLG